MIISRGTCPATGMPSEPTSLAWAAPQGSRQTVIGPRGSDLPGKATLASNATRPGRFALRIGHDDVERVRRPRIDAGVPLGVRLGFVDRSRPPMVSQHHERGTRDWLASISVGQAHVDDLGRCQRRHHRLRLRIASCLNFDCLEGKPLVADGQGCVQVGAEAVQSEAALTIGRDGLRPCGIVIGVPWPVSDTVEAAASLG
jgi:hypothetical protein